MVVAERVKGIEPSS